MSNILDKRNYDCGFGILVLALIILAICLDERKQHEDAMMKFMIENIKLNHTTDTVYVFRCDTVYKYLYYYDTKQEGTKESL